MADLILPPMLNAIEADKPFATAIKQVRNRQSGAGDLFWTPDKCVADFAIILEPEVDRKRSLEMLPLAMLALSDCLAILLPPQVAVQFRGSNQIAVNGGVAGGVTAGIAKTAGDKNTPDWLVLSIKIGLSRGDKQGDPGLEPDITTLDEEGWEDPDPNKFIETYARHFLSWMAAWSDDGFAPVVRAWKVKAEDRSEPDMDAVSNNISLYESTA